MLLCFGDTREDPTFFGDPSFGKGMVAKFRLAPGR